MTGQATNDGTRGFLRTIHFDQDRPETATVHYGHQADYKVHLFQRLIRPTSSILPLIKLAKVFHPNFRNQVPSLFYRSTKKEGFQFGLFSYVKPLQNSLEEKSRIVGLLFEPSIPLSFSFLFSLESSNNPHLFVQPLTSTSLLIGESHKR